jgi:hypothetical protein
MNALPTTNQLFPKEFTLRRFHGISAFPNIQLVWGKPLFSEGDTPLFIGFKIYYLDRNFLGLIANYGYIHEIQLIKPR